MQCYSWNSIKKHCSMLNFKNNAIFSELFTEEIVFSMYIAASSYIAQVESDESL